MPLLMRCPACGGLAPIPKVSGYFECAACECVLDIALYAGADAYERYAKDRLRRIFHPPDAHVKRPSIVFVDASQEGSNPSPGLTPDQNSHRP
jgi:hypothetical protein